MMRRDLIPLTAAGVLVVVLGAVAYVGGWQLGWVELMVVAAGCLTAVVLGAPFVVGRLRLDVVRTLEPARVMVGEPSLAVLNVANPKNGSVRPRIIEDGVADKYVRVEVPGLGSGESHRTVYNLPTERRGVVDIGPAVIAKQDPLQLLRREVRQAGPDRLWVHPRYVPLAPLPVGYAKDLEGPTSESSPAGDVAFHALREYEPGDDFRHIHWMSTARVGKPMVRHYVDNRRPQLAVVVDDRLDALTPEAFDTALEIAASVGVSSMIAQQPVAVWGSTGPILGRTKPGGRDDLLDRLTVAGPVRDGNLGQACSTALRTEAGTSAVVLITGAVPAEDLVPIASQIRRQARVIIVRIWDTDAMEAGFVPGARTLDVDSLERFGAAWSRVAR